MKHSYLGALHIHSTYSDGTRDVDYIIKQAARAGLKWIIITDHNTLDHKVHEGFHQGVCVIAGSEITPPTANHMLAFGINEKIPFEMGERNYIDEVHKQGGICFPAHPDESIHRKNPQRPLRWNDWSIDSFDGLEIWNYLTDWTDNYTNDKTKLFQYFRRHKRSKGPTRNVLAWWDRLNSSKDNMVPAIGGLDAHNFRIGRRGFLVRISDYYDFFCALNNIISLDEPLSPDFETAKWQIINALKNANNTLVNRAVTKNININFYALDKAKKAYAGEVLQLGEYTKIVAQLPKKATLRLIQDGVLIYENETKILEYDNCTVGKYRLEVYSNGIPWIFSNPIKIVE